MCTLLFSRVSSSAQYKAWSIAASLEKSVQKYKKVRYNREIF